MRAAFFLLRPGILTKFSTNTAGSRSMASYTHLVRFQADNGHIYYGDAIIPDHAKNMPSPDSARVITGDVLGEHTVTDDVLRIKKWLSPLAPTQTRTVRCLGLNYVNHAKEADMPIPERPVLFFKPNTALTGPHDNIPVHAVAQKGEGLDYEGELVIVIGREALNVSPDEAENYVLGYAVGNDVSHRDWQKKWGGGQWSLGKCYDGWAPWGPAIVTKKGLPNQSLKGLKLSTRVNQDVVQGDSLDDMIFNVREIVSFLSQGVTLLPGDLIFTGTPAGVQLGQQKPTWLKDGDEISVSIEGIGCITNHMQFIKNETS